MSVCDILLVGSSIFESWTTLNRALPNHNIVNRAVGGTETAYWLEKLPLALNTISPRVLAFYCGSNDLSRGKDADGVIDRTLKIVEGIRSTLPHVPIVYHSIIKAPEKQKCWADVDRVNEEIRNFLAEDSHAMFIDLNPLFFHSDGHIRKNFFQDDRLHLTPGAYTAMNGLCAPLLAHCMHTSS